MSEGAAAAANVVADVASHAWHGRRYGPLAVLVLKQQQQQQPKQQPQPQFNVAARHVFAVNAVTDCHQCAGPTYTNTYIVC